MADYEPGMNENSFNKFFNSMKNCHHVVPNVPWYRTQGGVGYSGEFTSNRKIELMEESYRNESVFMMEFLHGLASISLTFCFSRDLPNAGITDAWTKVSCSPGE